MTASPAPLLPRCDERPLWIDRVPHRICDCHCLTPLRPFTYRPELQLVTR